MKGLRLSRHPKGTYITIENKLEEFEFYIIRTGRIRLFSSITSEQSSLNKVLGVGDFFGVISCMTSRPRMQSALAVDDCELLVVKKQDFSQLIQASTPLALRILRSFSNDLRKYDEELIKKTLKTGEKVNPEQSFVDQGKYYYEKGDFAKAAYIFVQFLKHHPESLLVKETIEMLKTFDPQIFKDMYFSSSISRSYKDGQMLFCDKEPGFEMFLLETGQVKINKIIEGKEALIAVLQAGDVFGEMSLLNNKPRTATAVAFGEIKCTVFNLHNFNVIFTENPSLGLRIITLLSERIWTIYKQLDNFFFSDLSARIYDNLLTHLLSEKIPIAEGRQYAFPFGKEEVVKMLGIEGKEMEDAFDSIFNEGIVYVENNKLHCRDVSELNKEVDFARKMEQRNRKIRKSGNR